MYMASLIPAGRSSAEVSVAELREQLADVLNTVAYGNTGTPPVVYITRHGRRIAAIVPSSTAEDLEETFGRSPVRSTAVAPDAE